MHVLKRISVESKLFIKLIPIAKGFHFSLIFSGDNHEAFSGEFQCIPLLPPEGFAASYRVSVAPPATITTSARHSFRRTSPPAKVRDFSNLQLLEPPHQRHCCRLSPSMSTVSGDIHRLRRTSPLAPLFSALQPQDVNVNVFLQNPTFMTVIEDIMRSFSKQVDNATNNNDENDDGEDD
ncbi:unnamed protein product [Lactuca saligna]|uniref:Uncharacterized protein n=1 Tax=Lactuca saligna TaxID=75948 RepID=A0AA35Z619_LACSI|nr:unnamed protein product [Lactuca saligna]